MKQRKKTHKTTKNTLPNLRVISNDRNLVGVICEMDYGSGFPTMKGFEIDFKYFEDAVAEQRISPATQDEVDNATLKLSEYHMYGLPIDNDFIVAMLLYISTRKLAEDALNHQQNRTIGFLISINNESGDIGTNAMDYDGWKQLKKEMEKLCNKKFTNN